LFWNDFTTHKACDMQDNVHACLPGQGSSVNRKRKYDRDFPMELRTASLPQRKPEILPGGEVLLKGNTDQVSGRTVS
jgi:hypothetical protein